MSLQGVDIARSPGGRRAEVLTDDAIWFVADLERTFRARRAELLDARTARQARLDAGEQPDFLPSTAEVRAAEWRVADPAPGLVDRRVEITGPAERKMTINALNSGAKVFMADFEDATSPTWDNILDGQVNLIDAIERTIELTSPDGKHYRLEGEPATLVVRPRGWHLDERHVIVDGRPMSASLFDFGLYAFHNTARLADRNLAPYFYLPKLEGHLEARLWNDVFVRAQERLGAPRGTYRATVLLETILAAFEMDEILYELREHAAGLNAGRWDYIFSIIKKFRARPQLALPDRSQITMTVPFMRAYTDLLVATCHKRGAHAIGGMAAFIPSRRDPDANETALEKVRDDKEREANDGFDGSWVAHPDLVSVARRAFDAVLGDRPHQIERLRADVRVTAEQLLDFDVPDGTISDGGIRGNVSVALGYIESWLRGTGAAAINNLMEDAATAEIARSQIWHWVRSGARTNEGRTVDRELIEVIEEEELDRIRESLGDDAYARGRFADAQAIFERVALGDDFVDFLTTPALDYLD